MEAAVPSEAGSVGSGRSRCGIETCGLAGTYAALPVRGANFQDEGPRPTTARRNAVG